MPVDLPPKSVMRDRFRRRVLTHVLNWTAVVVCIGLCWWAIELGFWETMASLLS
jgi:hypothetical protein